MRNDSDSPDYQREGNEGGESNGGPTGSDGDTDSDSAPNATDKGSDIQTPTDSDITDTDTSYGPDAGEGPEKDRPLFENVFVSTPTPEGFATIVGLPGTVAPNDRVTVSTDDAEFRITVGRDGGFADRFLAGPNEEVTLVVTDASGEKTSVVLTTGALNVQFLDGIVSEEGQRRLTETLITVSGAGSHLAGSYFVVGGNLTQGTSAIATTICQETVCRFSMIISAVAGDTLDLFLIRETQNADFTSPDSRTGTVTQTLIAK